MKKKIFSKVLSVTLALSMMLACAACGKEPVSKTESEVKESTKTTQSSESAGAETTPAPEEREHVELVVYSPVSKVYAGMEETMKVVNEYLKEKLNTTIDMHFYATAEYNSPTNTALNAGMSLDLLVTGANSKMVPFVSNVEANAFLPLEDYIEEYLPETYKQSPQSAWDAYTVDGHVYGIPTFRDYATRYGLNVNTTMLDDLRLTMPDEWETYWDVIDFLYEAKAARDAKYPEKASQPIIKTHNKKADMWYDYEALASGVVTNIAGLEKYGFAGMGSGETAFCYYYTDEYREMMKQINQLVKDGILPFDIDNYDTDSVLFNSGEMLWGYSQGAVYVDEDKFAPAFKIALYPQTYAKLTTSGLQANGFAIPQGCKNVERCLEVIELLNTDEYLATVIRFGPEGVGWTDENNDGVIELTALNSDSKNRYWYQWYCTWLGGFRVTKLAPNLPTNMIDEMDKMISGAVSSSNAGFIPDTTAVTNEIAACQNVIAEYDKVLMLGQNDNVDELVDQFVAKLKQNGMDKIVDEIQKQLTEWRAAKGL